MIPLKLQIKNFLSYGGELQTIDFGNYNLICLSGKNGHGKSALLDAMTWAVWGQARKSGSTSKPDQGLLRLGQRHMMVIFDFLFNGNHYCVRREFTHAYGKNYAYLDFGMVDQQDTEKTTALTGKTIRETQEKIESIIGLNYDAFANSAFLRQGNSNEFSKKSSRERKDILGAILGLHRYEELRKLAIEKARDGQLQKEGFSKIQERLEVELKLVHEVERQLNALEQQLQKLVMYEQEQQQQMQVLEHKSQRLVQEKQKYALLIFHQEQLIKSIDQHIQEVKQVFAQWRLTQRQLHSLPDRLVLEQEKNLLEVALNEQQQKLQKSLLLKEQLLLLKEKEQQRRLSIEQDDKRLLHEKSLEEERIVANIATMQESYNILLQEKERFALTLQQAEQEHLHLQTQLKDTFVDENAIASMTQQFEKHKEYYHMLVARGNVVTTELEALQQKKLVAHTGNNPSCPLCLQPLTVERKQDLKKDFEKRENFLQHRLCRIKKLLPQLKQLLVEQHATIQQYKQQQEQHLLLLTRITHSEKQHLTHKEQHKIFVEKENLLKLELLELQQKQISIRKEFEALVNKANQALEQDEQYIQTVQQLTECSIALEACQYNKQEHERLVHLRQSLNEQFVLIANTNELKALQQERKQAIARLCAQARVIKKELQDLNLQHEQFALLPLQEKELAIQIEQLKQTVKEYTQQKEMLLQQQGSLRAQHQKLEQLSTEYKEQKKQIIQLEQAIDEYKDIALALSKDGIQALLIEEAIPEIEQEANYLLAKLTDNQAQIFIESLRDLKKGGTKETLDINIADGAGIRAYEMFSGGEAFRIDFALRIAISKLLARRAGTSLQTLIIDEGFGSQDEEGLAHIMDAIYKIQDDFAKIIIVSHLASMKDQFPVHFVVEKSVNGSRINVFEQG